MTLFQLQFVGVFDRGSVLRRYFRNVAFSLLSGFVFHLYSIKSIRSYENTK